MRAEVGSPGEPGAGSSSTSRPRASAARWRRRASRIALSSAPASRETRQQVEPDHEDEPATECAEDRRARHGQLQVDVQAVRRRQPQQRGEQSAGQVVAPAGPAVRHEVVHRGRPQHERAERDRPAQVGPEELVLRSETEARDGALGAAEDGSDDQQRDGQRPGDDAADAEPQSEPPAPPPAARLRHVVGDVHGVHQRRERRRERGERQQGGDGQGVRAGPEQVLHRGDGAARGVGEQPVEEVDDGLLDRAGRCSRR